MTIERIRMLAALWVLGWLLTGPGQAEEETPDLVDHTIQHGELKRVFSVHVPKGKRDTPNLPLVLVLHGGGGGDPKNLAHGLGFNALSDEEGFIVVYPKGMHRQWNDGRNAPFYGVDIAKVDDVGFINAVLDRMEQDYKTDKRRVYIAGQSNGGMMTHRLGMELSPRLAAIATIICTIPKNLLKEREAAEAAGKPAPGRLPVLIMNGTQDPVVPWEGGFARVGKQTFGEIASTRDTLAYYLKRNGLPAEPAIKKDLPDTDPEDGCQTQYASHTAENSTGEVCLYTITGGGHVWPGAEKNYRESAFVATGTKCKDFSGTMAVWEFFKRHARAENK